MRLTDHPDPDNPRVLRHRDEFKPGPDPDWRVPWAFITAAILLAAVVVTWAVFG